ncbi:DMT family transporter [Castellaniella caeni]|uniref:DMT family transporter n=1 Tax=Castellaniella caeni TaxID=266123 RepID=UPI00082C43D9|nr:DMT family transporter [Castellaniella caeni]
MHLLGVIFLICSSWSLSMLDASGKFLMGAEVGVTLMVLCLWRYLVHLLLALSVVVPARGWHAIRSARPGMQLARGISLLAVTMLFFMTLHYLPQAEATAMSFLAPLLMLVSAPWALGERAYLSRWVAAGIGFLGVLIIIRPGSSLDPVGVLYGLLTAGSMALLYIVSRKLAGEDPYTTLIWSGGTGSVALLALLPLYAGDLLRVLSGLESWHWLVLAGTGFWGALGHFLQIQAYRHAPASMLAPFLYFQIISATVLGWLIWGQFPDAISWLSIFVICASGIGIGVVEWRRTR